MAGVGYSVLEGASGVVAMAVVLGIGQGASLLWFFQGLRDPGPAAMLEVGFAIAATGAVLAMPGLSVGGVMAVQAGGVWAGWVATGILLLRRQRVQAPERGFVKLLIQGGPLFASRAVIVAYTGAGVLVVAALAGLFIPLAMERFGRDPAIGSSVFLTFVTDSMGFFIFLGLATIFLF